MYCILGSRTSLLMLILPCICPIFILSIFLNNKFLYPHFSESGGYMGLHLLVVLFSHLSFCLSVLFCSLHKAIYITSVTVGVKSVFLTVLVSIEIVSAPLPLNCSRYFHQTWYTMIRRCAENKKCNSTCYSHRIMPLCNNQY